MNFSDVSFFEKIFKEEISEKPDWINILNTIKTTRKHIFLDSLDDLYKNIFNSYFLLYELLLDDLEQSNVILLEPFKESALNSYYFFEELLEKNEELLGKINIITVFSGKNSNIFPNTTNRKQCIITTPEFFYYHQNLFGFDYTAVCLNDASIIKDKKRGKISFDIISNLYHSSQSIRLMLSGYNLKFFTNYIKKSEFIKNESPVLNFEFHNVKNNKNNYLLKLLTSLDLANYKSNILIFVSNSKSAEYLSEFINNNTMENIKSTPFYPKLKQSSKDALLKNLNSNKINCVVSTLQSNISFAFDSILIRDSYLYTQKLSFSFLNEISYKHLKDASSKIIILSSKNDLGKDIQINIRIYDIIFLLENLKTSSVLNWFQLENYEKGKKYTDGHSPTLLELLNYVGFLDRNDKFQIKISKLGKFVLENGLFLSETIQWQNFWQNFNNKVDLKKIDLMFIILAIEKTKLNTQKFEVPSDSFIWNKWLKQNKYNVVAQSLSLPNDPAVIHQYLSTAKIYSEQKYKTPFIRFIINALKHNLIQPFDSILRQFILNLFE